MKIGQLEQVLEVAKTGSLNRAAQNLFLSQPNLSLSIKNLEEELNIKIFERGTKGMSLTPLGKELIAAVEPIYNQLVLVPEIFREKPRDPPISFSLSNAFIKFAINVFIEAHNTFSDRPTSTSYRECSGGDVLEDVSSQRSDIGVLYLAGSVKPLMLKLFEYKGVTYHKLIDDNFKIILGPGNPMYYENRESVTLADLRDFPLVLYQEKHSPSPLTDRSGLVTTRNCSIIHVNNRASMLEMLHSTDAINIGTLSETPYKYTPFYAGLKTIPLLGLRDKNEVGWICRRNFVPNIISKFYVERLIEISTGEKPTPFPIGEPFPVSDD